MSDIDVQLLWALRVLRELDNGHRQKESDVNQAVRIIQVSEKR